MNIFKFILLYIGHFKDRFLLALFFILILWNWNM